MIAVMFGLLKKLLNFYRYLAIKLITESICVYIAIDDYCLWRLIFDYLPSRLSSLYFTMFTGIQLYFLGTRYLLKEVYRKYSTKVRKLSKDEPDIPNFLAGYVVIVTGGSRGIGLSAAKDFYRRGATVIVTSSVAEEADRERMAKSFRDAVVPSVPGGTIYVWQIDFRDFNTVCDFTARFHKTYDHLEVLVNNAGVMFVDRQYTTDGYEHHYQINYLSHVLMTWLLMPALAAGRVPARVVNVSSSTHYPRPAFVEDLQSFTTPYSRFHSYAQSKLCQIMLTYYMADWFRAGSTSAKKYQPILVNSLHPGVAKTELYVNVWWVKMFPALASLLFRTPDEGAETVTYAALSTEVVTGGHYFEDCASICSSKFSYNKIKQARLAQITRIQLEDIIEKYNRDYPSFKVDPLLQE